MENVAQVTVVSDGSEVATNQSGILVVESSQHEQTIIFDGKAPQIGWGQDVEISTEERPNQMKIIGQQNETLGNISLSHEQLMSILANKSDGGIVTLHIQNDDGVTNPVQLQIVPEDQVQVYQTFENAQPPAPVPSTVTTEVENVVLESESKITPVLQLAQHELQNLVKGCDKPIKSIAFKVIKKSQETNNCITSNPRLQRLIKRKTYLDLAKNEVMQETSSTKTINHQYKCSKCNCGFTTSGNLKRHILNIHSDSEKTQNHTCRECGKRYSRQDYLTQHIKAIHEKITKHTCEQCGKNFTQKGSMMRHFRSVHLNIKDFPCKHCDYKAMSYNDLKKHAAKAHFNRSRYECSICDFNSWSASVIKRHILNFHSNNKKTNSRKCRYCNVVIDLSNESYPLHLAACKTMLHPTGRDNTASTGKRKRKRVPSMVETSNELPVEDDAIPWEAMCCMADEEDQVEVDVDS